MTRALASIALAAALVTVQEPAPQVFRSATHAVAVDVAVFEGSRVVTGLGVQDFELRDNGVVQTITTADFHTLPIDLRLVFDTSGSISDADLALYLNAMRKVAGSLEPRDRCEIITFNARFAQAATRQSPPITVALQREGPEGTSFFDAVSLAMVTEPTTDRRQITIVLSDARDNMSFFDETTLLETARRTDAVVYTILPGDPTRSRAVSVSRLQAIALLTGGRLVRTHETAVGEAVIDAIEEFRQSYMLRYMLNGVPIQGWHKLEVKIRGGGWFRVRMRLGYFGR
jgi:VWFA-related protein